MNDLNHRLRRGGYLPVAALAAILLGACFLVGRLAPGTGLVLGQPGTGDFVQYWASHQALESGRNAYDGIVLHEIERQEGQSDDETILMWNPPWTVWMLEPVVDRVFPQAALLWFVTSVVLLSGIAILLPEALGRGTPHLVPVALAAGLFYPVTQSLVLGQLSIFLTFFFVLFLHFESRGERFAAGLAVVPLTAKPHLFFLLAIPGLLWLVQLPARERIRFLAGAAGGVAAIVVATALRWPDALGWWEASLSAPPRGPGAVPMEQWRTSALATTLRSMLAAPDGSVLRWPMWAVPLAGLSATAAYFVRHRRRRIVWADVAPPLMCLSLTLGSYGWTFDQSLLLPVQVALVCDAVSSRDRGAAARVLGLLVAIQLVAVVVGIGPEAAHEDYIWLPWAMLGAWIYARRQFGAAGGGVA